MDSSGSVALQERGSIGSQYHCSKIGKSPGHQAQTSQVVWPRAPERSGQEPPSIGITRPPLPPARTIPGAPLFSAPASLQAFVHILVKSDFFYLPSQPAIVITDLDKPLDNQP